MVAQFSISEPSYSALNRNTRNKRLLTIIGAIGFFFILSLVHVRNYAQLSTSVKTGLVGKRKIVGENWIVVTTINEPTDAMDLLCNLEGWNVSGYPDQKGALPLTHTLAERPLWTNIPTRPGYFVCFRWLLWQTQSLQRNGLVVRVYTCPLRTKRVSTTGS